MTAPERAQRALVAECTPSDRFALAARLTAEGRTMWLVMAAYDDRAHDSVRPGRATGRAGAGTPLARDAGAIEMRAPPSRRRET